MGLFGLQTHIRFKKLVRLLPIKVLLVEMNHEFFSYHLHCKDYY